MRFLFTICLCIAYSFQGIGQEYDYLIKGAYLVDAKNKIHDTMDIAVLDGKIAAVAKNLSQSNSKKVIDASGLILSPGLIDPHTHVFRK